MIFQKAAFQLAVLQQAIASVSGETFAASELQMTSSHVSVRNRVDLGQSARGAKNEIVSDVPIMPFDKPSSSFSALRTRVGSLRHRALQQENACEVGPSADDSKTCGSDQFCKLDAGVCNTFSAIHEGVCQPRPETCSFIFIPVCGCDGETYSSQCDAHSKGASVSYEGECEKSSDPSVGTGMVACEVGDGTCGDGQFCQLDDGLCDASSGTCQTKPDACYEMYTPVCGCDGETYDNECFAQAAGVSVSQKGVCDATPAAGMESDRCEVGPSADPAKSCGASQFCHLDAGVCNSFSAIHNGTCQEKPEACTMDERPVCGCDGQTYSNECVAHSKGASVSYEGRCDAKPADPSIGTGIVRCEVGYGNCAEGQFCQLDTGVCDASSGTCQTKPDTCHEMYAPVCGCDGVTYDNACFAQAAGVSVSQNGVCDATPAVGTEAGGCEVGPSANPTKGCGASQFCQLDAGVCNTFSAIHEGVCQEKPEACTMDVRPVCGCDGQTHSNECAARSKGASVSYEGACNKPSDQSVGTVMVGCEIGPAANPDKACEAGQFCQLDVGACNTRMAFHEGTCQPTPDVCNEMYQPVCGCDEKTYENDCYAQLAGVSVSRKGECDAVETEMAACETGPSADPSKSCGTGQFCKLDAGVCNTFSAIHQGTCQTMPDVCDTEYSPVCGCDGDTYSNKCAAHEAGTSVSFEGECNKPSDPSVGTGSVVCEIGPAADTSKACGAGQFCQLEAGVCNTKTSFYEGVCEPKPDVCNKMYAPVCGCDGETYVNSCYAQLADVSISSKGECDAKKMNVDAEPVAEIKLDACEAGSSANLTMTCGEDQFCKLDIGVCDTSSDIQQGVCQALSSPDVCNEMYAPVCGCDGETYDNECYAQVAGVSVSREGECDSGRDQDPDKAISPGSAFNLQRSSFFHVAIALMTIAVLI